MGQRRELGESADLLRLPLFRSTDRLFEQSLFLCALFVGAVLFTELVRMGGPSLHTL